MKNIFLPILGSFCFLLFVQATAPTFSFLAQERAILTAKITSYQLNPQKQDLRFFWKNASGENYGNFQNLKSALEKEGRQLRFAMNGGMYLRDQSPQGLFIENGIQKKKLDTIQEGYGNFYLQPNGVFYLTNEKKPVICPTSSFQNNGNIEYATQSGPMLLIEGKYHPKIRKGSPNLHIRNAVGILPNGNLLFAISKEPINFYDLATFFKEKGCKNALYLDGFVSRTYIPSQNRVQMDGSFGVIIAEVSDKE